MKKTIKAGSGKRRFFKPENKRAYIALLILVVLVGVSVTARNRAMKSMEKQASFDDEAWKAAVKESGIEIPEATAKPELIQVPEETEKTVLASAEAAPIEETAEPEPQPVAAAAAATQESLFIQPINGSVLKDFSGDELVYSETMEDWRTHNGIDFAAEEGDQVVAVAKGTVKKVYADDMLGITVEIEHAGGVVSRYSGLQSLSFITEGKEVSSGDIIGGVGETGALEEGSQPHLHFEIIKNGEYENPNLYFAK